MLKINVDNIGDLAIVECEGRIVQSEAAYKLREAVISQKNAGIVVLELSEVYAIEGGGLGMLLFLQRWARDRNIRFKLFNPSKFVRERLNRASSFSDFDIPTLDEMMALLACADGRYAASRLIHRVATVGWSRGLNFQFGTRKVAKMPTGRSFYSLQGPTSRSTLASSDRHTASFMEE